MKVPERIPPAGVTPPIMSAPVAPITLATPTIPAVQISPSKNSKAEKTEKNDMVNSVGDHIVRFFIYIRYTDISRKRIFMHITYRFVFIWLISIYITTFCF